MADPIPLRAMSGLTGGNHSQSCQLSGNSGQLDISDPLTAFDRFIAVYPRQASVGTARGRWMWALAKVNNDHDLLIRAAATCAAYHQSRNTAIEFIAKPHAWLDAEGWLDRYELPKAPPAPPHDAAAARKELIRKAALGGNRFSADLFRRDYGEEPEANGPAKD